MTTVTEGEARKNEQLSRRDLLVVGAAGAATAALVGADIGGAQSARYPRLKIIELSKLKANRPVQFAYPLQAQPNVLIDLGRQVPGGVGPRKSIVAHSILCQHMGCPVEYRRGKREFFCPCHQTRYDPERLGSIIQGLAMEPLPRVHLRVRSGAVWAVGITGLVYGYRDNLAPGKRVGGAG